MRPRNSESHIYENVCSARQEATPLNRRPPRALASLVRKARVKILQVLCPASLLAVSCALAQAPFGAMQGLVTAEDGSPIPGAAVLYSRLTPTVRVGRQVRPAPGEAVVRSTVSSDASGRFALSSLPPGDYLLCAEVPSAPYLNPCKWSSSLRASILAGAVHRPTLVLKKGVFLKVRVNDPAGLLPPVKDGPLRAANLIVGVVFGDGAFLGATNTSVVPTGRDYQMAIPAGVPLKLWAFSRHVTLTDSRGSPVDNSGARIPFQATAGQDQFFVLNVSGRDSQSP